MKVATYSERYSSANTSFRTWSWVDEMLRGSHRVFSTAVIPQLVPNAKRRVEAGGAAVEHQTDTSPSPPKPRICDLIPFATLALSSSIQSSFGM